jgi:hypothetical protein
LVYINISVFSLWTNKSKNKEKKEEENYAWARRRFSFRIRLRCHFHLICPFFFQRRELLFINQNQPGSVYKDYGL